MRISLRTVAPAGLGVAFLGLAFVVGSAWTADARPKDPKPAATPAALVDLNSASEKDLEGLNGVGAATAKKIIAGRPYASVDDLAKAGISAATIAKIKPQVTVGAPSAAPAAASAPPPTGVPAPAATPKPAKAPKATPTPAALVDLNSASEKELEELNGVGLATAKKIIAGRPFATVDDLSKAGVSASTITKIKPHVTVGVVPAVPATASAAAPVAPPPPVPTPTPAPVATPKPAKAPKPSPTPATTAAPATPPQPGMVWVNTSTKVFHREGDRYYGNTKHGKWMTEEDAVKAGYREAKTEGAPKAPGN
ncbi:MAG: ComEA family DNA-binding protein [Vicinamibacteria bacterium]